MHGTGESLSCQVHLEMAHNGRVLLVEMPGRRSAKRSDDEARGKERDCAHASTASAGAGRRRSGGVAAFLARRSRRSSHGTFPRFA